MPRLWLWTFVAALAAVTIGALLPAPPPGVDLGWDKAHHVLAFALLAALAARALVHGQGWPPAAVYGGLIGWGVLIEAAQSFTPSRQAEALDVVADAIGVLAVMLALRLARGLSAPR